MGSLKQQLRQIVHCQTLKTPEKRKPFFLIIWSGQQFLPQAKVGNETQLDYKCFPSTHFGSVKLHAFSISIVQLVYARQTTPARKVW